MNPTFKQFLEGANVLGNITYPKIEPLEILPIQIFFEKELKLPKDEAEQAAQWFLGHEGFEELDEVQWKIIDFVELKFPDIYDTDDRFEIEDRVHKYLKDILKRKYGVKV